MEYLTGVINEINHLPYDIRAEVLLNHLLDKGIISDNEYIVKHQGQFVRGYRADVLSAKLTDFNYDPTQLIEVSLSRDSLYDILPEGVVHHAKNETQGKGVETMLKDYRERKQEEKAARTFFSPFENEIFKLGVEIESFEQDNFKELNANEISTLFYELWGISKDFPTLLVSKFIRLLPYSYRIVGNISLTVQILSKLLGEEVQLKEREFATYSNESQGFCLGEDIYLGVDMITGTAYEDYTKHLTLEIGPLKHSAFTDYILGGNKEKFVTMFCEHFFPLEVEIQLSVLLSEEESQFELKENNDPILGYNTCI